MKKFEEPKLDVIRFDSADIIVTSTPKIFQIFSTDTEDMDVDAD